MPIIKKTYLEPNKETILSKPRLCKDIEKGESYLAFAVRTPNK